MKKILIISLLVLCYVGYTNALTIVSGTWNRNGNTVYFYEVENGQLKEKANYIIAKDKKFGFALNLDKEGYYVIGTKNSQLMTGKFIFYLKSDDQLNVSIGTNDYELIGENTAENKTLKEWFDLLKPINMNTISSKKGMFMTYAEYYPILEEVFKKAESWNLPQSDNKTFDESFLTFRKYDIALDALQFLFLPKTKQPDINYQPDCYKNFTFSKLCNSDQLMNYPFGNRLLANIDLYAYQVKKKANSSIEFGTSALLNDGLSNIKDELLKGELVLIYAKHKQTVEGLLNFQKEYSKYLTTESQNERFKVLLANKAKNSKGDTAIDFKFPNSEGKEISLSSFKGKAVYIDIWATWCGPCKKEIPHLIKLEEEYKDKDIVFLSVSIDAQSDLAKWKKFIVDNNMKGVQLFAGDKADDISKPYKLNGIPHFILIDKNGLIVSQEAPRPSSPEIRLLLDNTLLK